MKNYKFKINGTEYNVDINSVEGQEIALEVNGTAYKVTMDQEVKPQPVAAKPRPRAAAAAPAAAAPKAAAGTKVTTPLPGVILDVFVNVGDTVKEGQKVCILEAMKMENEITADAAGTVTEVRVRKGDSVLESDVLVVIG